MCLTVSPQKQQPGWLTITSKQTTICDGQAQEAVSSVKPEKAQARGRALLNLKLRDAEGGLLGRTLLTFILNKVQDSTKP